MASLLGFRGAPCATSGTSCSSRPQPFTSCAKPPLAQGPPVLAPLRPSSRCATALAVSVPAKKRQYQDFEASDSLDSMDDTTLSKYADFLQEKGAAQGGAPITAAAATTTATTTVATPQQQGGRQPQQQQQQGGRQGGKGGAAPRAGKPGMPLPPAPGGQRAPASFDDFDYGFDESWKANSGGYYTNGGGYQAAPNGGNGGGGGGYYTNGVGNGGGYIDGSNGHAGGYVNGGYSAKKAGGTTYADPLKGAGYLDNAGGAAVVDGGGYMDNAGKGGGGGFGDWDMLDGGGYLNNNAGGGYINRNSGYGGYGGGFTGFGNTVNNRSYGKNNRNGRGSVLDDPYEDEEGESPVPRVDSCVINGKTLQCNAGIKVSEVYLLGEDRAALGAMSTYKALELAEQAKQDLVLITPDASPPVARIIDWSKYKYELEKGAKERKAKSTNTEVKEVRLRPGTDSGDLATKMKSCEKFLSKGDRVKLVMKFEGRELQFKEQGKDSLLNFISELAAVSKVEGPLNFKTGTYTIMLAPLK